MSSILIRRANMVAVGSGPTPGRLPAGYTELAYLESTGTQYIDIGYALRTGNDDTEVDFYLPDTSQTRIFGARTSTTSRTYALDTDSSGNIRFGWGSSTSAATAATVGRHVAKVNHSGGTLEVDGVVVITKGNASTNTPYHATIFAIQAQSMYYAASGLRIYSFKLWRSANLARDLVPAKRDSDSVVGMYDLVNDEFLINAGSGTFNYGTL